MRRKCFLRVVALIYRSFSMILLYDSRTMVIFDDIFEKMTVVEKFKFFCLLFILKYLM